MATRVKLRSGEHQWTADVAADTVTLADRDGGAFTLTLDGAWTEIERAGRRWRGAAAQSGDTIWVQLDGEVFDLAAGRGARRSAARDADALTPPMSATVTRIAVKAGDAVRQGDVLIALEAMKMELPLRAPRDGVVVAIHCKEGQLVQPGEELVVLGSGVPGTGVFSTDSGDSGTGVDE